MADVFRTYTLFDHPSDYPEWYVLRSHAVYPGGKIVAENPALLFRDVEKAREWCMQRGLYRMARKPEDPPAILEVWL